MLTNKAILPYLDIPKMVARNITLSIGLEPLADKAGLTTRFYDSSPNAKLEYFIVGAINIQWPFYDLAFDMIQNNIQPESIFKYAYRAQLVSVYSRGGSKVTFGQTLLLIPLVAAHLNSVLNGNKFEEIRKVADYLSLTLSQASPEDIKDLELFCKEALTQSKKSNKKAKIERAYPNPVFYGKYKTFKETINQPDFNQLVIAREIFTGFKNVFEIFEQWQSFNQGNLLAFTEKIYPDWLKKFGRGDIAADLIAAALYLILCSEPELVFFD